MTEINRTKPMLPISSVAETVGVHQRTLRIWNEEGILVPQRSPKNRRLYSFEDIDRGRLIHKMTNSGVSLAGVKLFFALTKEMPIELKSDEFEALSKELKLVTTANIKGRKSRK